MKKLEILGDNILVFCAVITFFIILFYIKLLPPSVKQIEKKNVTIYVEDYLTKKYGEQYGEQNFKVTKIEYDFYQPTMAEMFDYSMPVGYYVSCRSDKVKYFFVYIDGIYPNKYTIERDNFLDAYYFPD